MKENYRLNFDTIYEKNEYLIYAVFLTNTTEITEKFSIIRIA